MPRPLARCSRTPMCVRRTRLARCAGRPALITRPVRDRPVPRRSRRPARLLRRLRRALPLVGGALRGTMAEVVGAAWQPELTTEWTRAYQTVAQIMIDGVGQSAAARRQGPDLDHFGGL